MISTIQEGQTGRTIVPFGTTILLHHFDGSLTPEVGNSFSATGTSFTSTNALFTQSLDVGGTAGGGGGNHVVKSTVADTLYDLGTADFTIEGWIWFNSAPTRPRTLISISTGLNQDFTLGADVGITLFGYPTSGGLSPHSLGLTPPINAWTHLAMTREGDIYRGFANGHFATPSFTQSFRPTAGAKGILIGNGASAVDGLDGMIDEVRVVSGVALYTSNFDPPTYPFTG